MRPPKLYTQTERVSLEDLSKGIDLDDILPPPYTVEATSKVSQNEFVQAASLVVFFKESFRGSLKTWYNIQSRVFTDRKCRVLFHLLYR